MHASKPFSTIRRAGGRGAFTLVEVLVALVILGIGVVGILQLFPPSLRASTDAALKSRAVLLARMKIEEIRRDADSGGELFAEIRNLGLPTIPVPFPEDPRLTYQFSGVSQLEINGIPGDPQFNPGVARVIIRYNAEFRPSADILYELRFDG